MDADRYLQLLEDDARRLSGAARRIPPAASIPTCPGWRVQDCVAHTAEVYQHKIACMRLQRRPGDEYEQEPPAGVSLPDWLDRSLATLLDELRTRGPSAPAYTWWQPDQTVGFWYRRMAQETAVHRVDVEAADPSTPSHPIDAELAIDGIDEVLERFLADDWDTVTPDEWGDVDPHAGSGQAIVVRSGHHAWRSTLDPDRIPFERLGSDDDPRADAIVSGEPEAVLLWLWGRRPDEAVELTGEPATLTAFRDRLRVATQ